MKIKFFLPFFLIIVGSAVNQAFCGDDFFKRNSIFDVMKEGSNSFVVKKKDDPKVYLPITTYMNRVAAARKSRLLADYVELIENFYNNTKDPSNQVNIIQELMGSFETFKNDVGVLLYLLNSLSPAKYPYNKLVGMNLYTKQVTLKFLLEILLFEKVEDLKSKAEG